MKRLKKKVNPSLRTKNDGFHSFFWLFFGKETVNKVTITSKISMKMYKNKLVYKEDISLGSFF